MLLKKMREFIALDVSDKPGTSIKQRARARKIVISWSDDTAELSVVLTANVDAFNSENGAYGVRLQGAGIDTWSVELHGDNNSAVNPLTGQVILNRDTQNNETPAAWLARAEADPQKMQLQGDWLADLLHNPNLSVAALALGQMQAADAPPYNKFAR